MIVFVDDQWDFFYIHWLIKAKVRLAGEFINVLKHAWFW